MPRASIGYLDLPAVNHNRMVSHIRRRAELLGVDLLAPDFRFQTAQFCEEAENLLGESELQAPLGLGNSYGARLEAWWEAWCAQDIANDGSAMYRVLLTQFRGRHARQ
jgi:hypothetical protein